jgi:hypothetical protein
MIIDKGYSWILSIYFINQEFIAKENKKMYDFDMIEEFCDSRNFEVLDLKSSNPNERMTFVDKDEYKYCLTFHDFMHSLKGGSILSRFGISNVFNIENIINWTRITNKYFLRKIPESYSGVNQMLDIYDNNGYFYSICFNDLRRSYEGNLNLLIIGTNNVYSVQNIEKYLEINKISLRLAENQDYTGSKCRLFFYCSVCNEDEPFDAVWNLIQQGQGCPYCWGRKIGKKNSLMAIYPEISEDWDYEKNFPDTPETVAPQSNSYRFWIGKDCGHKWRSAVSNRTGRGQGCPICGKVKASISKSKFHANKCSIEDHNPELVAEWSDMNEKSPREYSYGSNKVVYWKCLSGFGHPDFSAIIKCRTSYHSGCPKCSESHGEKVARCTLEELRVNYIRQASFDDCRFDKKLKFDFFMPDLNTLLEIQGEQHYVPIDFNGMGLDRASSEFEKNKIRDAIKRKYCLDNGIKMIEIPYWDFKNIKIILEKEISPLLEERR